MRAAYVLGGTVLTLSSLLGVGYLLLNNSSYVTRGGSPDIGNVAAGISYLLVAGAAGIFLLRDAIYERRHRSEATE